MRELRDTFLKFLEGHDYLTALTIPVHNVRRDPNFMNAELLQLNAVNIQFLTTRFAASGYESRQLTSIDVVHEDELTALDWTSAVAKALQTAGYVPKLDYSTDPPTATGKLLYWNPKSIDFRPVSTDSTHVRFSALLSISTT